MGRWEGASCLSSILSSFWVVKSGVTELGTKETPVSSSSSSLTASLSSSSFSFMLIALLGASSTLGEPDLLSDFSVSFSSFSSSSDPLALWWSVIFSEGLLFTWLSKPVIPELKSSARVVGSGRGDIGDSLGLTELSFSPFSRSPSPSTDAALLRPLSGGLPGVNSSDDAEGRMIGTATDDTVELATLNHALSTVNIRSRKRKGIKELKGTKYTESRKGPEHNTKHKFLISCQVKQSKYLFLHTILWVKGTFTIIDAWSSKLASRRLPHGLYFKKTGNYSKWGGQYSRVEGLWDQCL